MRLSHLIILLYFGSDMLHISVLIIIIPSFILSINYKLKLHNSALGCVVVRLVIQ